MQAQAARSALSALLNRQRALEARTGPTSPIEILAEGAALLAFAEYEEEAFAALLDLVDPSVRATERFTEDDGGLICAVEEASAGSDRGSSVNSAGTRA